MTANSSRTRRLIVPEVVQTSPMDGGPASLKCLFEGFGIPVSYGRLREACQTDVDGTSINTMEEVAVQLGLEAEQIMVPVDHVLLPEARALPAIIVTRHSEGTHFLVAWRRHGRFVQVMDPATGRLWPTCQRFLEELYVHVMPVPAAAWREWAGSDEFLSPLRRRLANLGLGKPETERIIDAACADPSWHSLAALDAAARMVDSIVRSGGLRRGRQAARVLEAFFERARKETQGEAQTIPATYWSVQPASPGPDGEEKLLLQGAVLVRVCGRRPVERRHTADGERAGEPAPLSPELIAALEEPPTRLGREFLRLLRADGLLTPTALVAALALAAGGVMIEALLFRGLFALGRELDLTGQRLGAIGAFLVFVAALLLLELPIVAGLLRLGRHLEARLRIAFLGKIPRLGDRYFRSRPTWDMTERSHSAHKLRLLPELGGQFIRLTFELALTTAGIVWLEPASAPIAILAAALAVGLPLAAQPLLAERDLRVHNHAGAIGRFYLDALLGLVAVRAHGAERAVRREHENLLAEWARAGLGLQRAVVAVKGLQSFVGFGLAAWLLLDHLTRGGEVGGVLLLIYWALNLPFLGQEIALITRQYPSHRSVTLRLLEPLGAPEEADTQEPERAVTPVLADVPAKLSGGLLTDSSVALRHACPERSRRTQGDQERDPFGQPFVLSSSKHEREPLQQPARGVAIAIEGVSVRVAGHTILEGIDLTIEAGSQVAIIGPSGAGKSSLVGVLLGWYRPATGQVLVDGFPLQAKHLARLRRETAWVDPAVQLWNRPFLDNLSYGAPADSSLPIDQVIEQAELRAVLEKLPEGLQTPLGESGALVSGGEGQRVRLGRAMLRSGVRLVILDEPFRGLDREQRRELLARARRWWRDTTLLCITHDVGETLAFERVLVIEGGRIVEDGVPSDLAERPGSRYQSMLEAEEAVREGLWSSDTWRRLRLEGGQLFADSWSTGSDEQVGHALLAGLQAG